MRKRALVTAAFLLAACGEAPIPPAAPTSRPPPGAEVSAAPVAPAPPLPPPAVDVTVRRTVFINSRPSGSQVTTIHPDGSRDLALEILQNGRGPKTAAHLRVAPDHTIVSFDASGHEEMNEPVDEHFFIEGGRATWKSASEHGSKVLTGPAFYLPLASERYTSGLLAEALIAAGGRIDLLPEGEASIDRVGETTIKNAAGESKHLVAWATTGVEFSPDVLWLDDARTYWGRADALEAIVPEGWESAVAPLQAQGKAIDRARLAALAQKLAQKPPAAGLAITHARVLDVVGKRWLLDQTVLVAGAKIAAVGPTKTTTIPALAETIDAGGKALIPGLWDMHAHLDESTATIDLAAGVTTARDLGNDLDFLDDMQRRFDEGTAIGPRVVKAGLIEGRGPKAAASRVTAETPDEARAGVEQYFKHGDVQIKIYNSVKPELVPVIAKAAHADGMRVSGHVPVHMKAEEAVRAGYDEINHINMLFLNFFVDRDTDTRTPLRFTLVAERASSLDLSSKPVKSFFALLKERKTVVDPTLGVFENLFVDRPGEIGATWRPVASRMPATVRRGFLAGGLPVPDGQDQTYRDAFKACLRMVKALYDQKTPIVAGTDSIGGLALPRELELYVEAGMPTADVMQIATIGAARVMKMDKTTGSIDPGKDADLVLLDGDPLQTIGDLRNVRKVVRGGVVYDSAPVFETVGIGPPAPATP